VKSEGKEVMARKRTVKKCNYIVIVNIQFIATTDGELCLKPAVSDSNTMENGQKTGGKQNRWNCNAAEKKAARMSKRSLEIK
jgi:hypothetical protein